MKRRDFLGLLGATVVLSPRLAAAQPASDTLRILIIANKGFEADPLVGVLGNEEVRNPELSLPRDVAWPRAAKLEDSEIQKRPRCIIDFTAGGKKAEIEVWCLDDLMSKHVSHSRSKNKAGVLPFIRDFRPKAPDGVVAFGTGAFPSKEFRNGSVAVGGTLFIHDANGQGQDNWTWPNHMEKLIASKTPASFYSAVAADQSIKDGIKGKFLMPPVNDAAASPTWMISSDAVAIATVNFASAADFAKIDHEAVELAKAAGATTITSVETTHGVIRSAFPDAHFIYVTGIPNRIGHFGDEAHGRYPQNFVAAHNAGIVASFILPSFVREISK